MKRLVAAIAVVLLTAAWPAVGEDITSRPFVARLKERPPVDPTTRRALMIAVTETPHARDPEGNPLPALRYTAKGTLALAGQLRRCGFTDVVVAHDDPALPRDSRGATRADVEQAVAQLLGDDHGRGGRVRDGDCVLLYFATHGWALGGEPMIVPHDARNSTAAEMVQTSIPLRAILDRLERVNPSGPKLLVVDACRPEADIEGEAISQFLPQVHALGGVRNLCVLLTCQPDRRAYEDAELENGVFTHFFTRGLQGAADFGPQGDFDGRTSVLELFQYAQEQVRRHTGTPRYRRQQAAGLAPQVCVLGRAEDFPNFILGRVPPVWENSLGMKLRLVLPGRYTTAIGGKSREIPVEKAFYVGTCEVTLGQFRAFVEQSGYRTEVEQRRQREESQAVRYEARAFGGGHDERASRLLFDRRFDWREVGWSRTDEHPVVNVTYGDAERFCRWLTERERGSVMGQAVYRLPDGEQWMYAAYAGGRAEFDGGQAASVRTSGNVADAALASALSSFDAQCEPWDDGFAFTAPVGRFQPNAWGLFDMHGNVWEWVTDQVRSSRHAMLLRAIRGGAFDAPARLAGSSSFFQWRPDEVGADIGFRVVLDAGSL